MEHFIKHVKSLPEQKILPLLGGHQSHKTIEVIDLARARNITMITLPPHTSHRLQPLDVTFFGPLRTLYNREIDHWMLRNPGKQVSDYDIVDIFAQLISELLPLKAFYRLEYFPLPGCLQR